MLYAKHYIKMAQFGYSKESTEYSGKGRAYKWIRTQLLEIKDQLKINSQMNNEHKKLVEKFTTVINTFEEVDKTFNEEKHTLHSIFIVLRAWSLESVC